MEVPGSNEFSEVIEAAIDILKHDVKSGFLENLEVAERRNGIVYIDDYRGSVMVVGDLHGDYRTLSRVLEFSNKVDFTVFLGDYIDRGPLDEQIMVIFKLLDILVSGRRIVLLRGNHEAPRGLEPSGQDFPYAIYKFYKESADNLIRLFNILWDLMPYALVARGHALMLHGGPPTINLDSNLFEYLGVNSNDKASILEEILWNDPVEADLVRMPNPRGAGSLWGRPVTRIALEKLDGRVIIRGHEAVMRGYKWNHEGRVLTIFTSKIPAYPVEYASVVVCDLSRIQPYREDCIRRL